VNRHNYIDDLNVDDNKQLLTKKILTF